MISTFFFGLNKVNGGASRPRTCRRRRPRKVGVLGAGMMGQGIAYVSAMAGIEVVLKDMSLEAAEKGKAYSREAPRQARERGRMTPGEARRGAGALITPTATTRISPAAT
jgi:3-hydroxyacyl-CoA dehydrogenase/enoyl-CoA hydratase/3-hydroxybutyryl-CoA epimerase